MSEEVWADTQYTGFQVSSHGKVRSAHGRLLKVQPKFMVNLSKGLRSEQIKVSVPKMMYQAFIGPVGSNWVTVKDGILRVENLELQSTCTRAKIAITIKHTESIAMDRAGMARLLCSPWVSVSTDTGWAGGW